jgi:hypothetical protein
VSADKLDEQEEREGWMAEKPHSVRRYHYIRGTVALCRGYGFYRGELTPYQYSPTRGREDCAACFKILLKWKRGPQ